MANVLFKRGLQADLWKLMEGGATDGCFYLTTDSHRLYVGQGSKAVPVNEGVTTVDTLGALSNIEKAIPADERHLMAGAFYYVANDNILCVYNGEQFVQINPDTNTDTRITDVDTKVDASKEKIVVTSTLTQQLCKVDTGEAVPTPDGSLPILNPIEIKFEISADQFNALVQEVNVGLDLSATPTEATITTTGFGAEKDSISFKAGEAINFGYDAATPGVVTISSKDTKHTIGVDTSATDKAVVKLSSDNESHAASSIEFKAGNDLTVKADATGVTYTHKEYENKSADVTRDSSNTTLGHEGKFSIISKIESNNGHITNVETQELTLPQDNHITSGVLNKETGEFTFAYAKTTTPNITIDTKGTYHTEGTGTWHVGGELNVYTTEEIDSKIAEVKAQANALTYRGVVKDFLPDGEEVKVSIGDVYMAGAANIYDGNNIGDLFIAVGKDNAEEDENGYLAQADITWEIVPSGNDLDTKYDLLFNETLDGAVIQLKNTTDSADVPDSINIHDDGSLIQISVETNEEDSSRYIKVAHKTFADEPEIVHASEVGALVPEDEFTVVSGITTDKGHVTKVATKNYKLPLDTKYTIGIIDEDAEDNSVAVKLSSPNNTGVESKSVNIGSEDKTLIVTANGDNIDIKHADMQANEEGTPAGETVPMVSEQEFTVITGVNLNNGHLVDYTKTTYKLPQSDKYVYEGAITKVDDVNKVNIDTALYDSQGLPQKRFAYDVTSNSLSLNVSAAVMDGEVMTTPAALSIEMVWGTF